MRCMLPVVLVTTLLATPLSVRAETEQHNTADSLPPTALDSPAQAVVRKLADNTRNGVQSSRLTAEAKIHPDLITRLEEIRVYGRNEPEDFVGQKLSPLMQFRARLENDVPLTPAKKAQRALCFIGLCGIYGPEGIPLGDSPERRAQARLIQSTVQSLSAPY